MLRQTLVISGTLAVVVTLGGPAAAEPGPSCVSRIVTDQAATGGPGAVARQVAGFKAFVPSIPLTFGEAVSTGARTKGTLVECQGLFG